jgi:peptidyl-prolyl cis-trans isomerase C
MKTKLALAAVLSAALLLGCEQEAETTKEAKEANAPVLKGEAVAYVNGEPISKQMFEFHLERRTQGQPDRASPQDREALLNELVEMTLLAQAAREKNLGQDPVVAARIENLRTAILAQAAVEQLMAQAPDEAAIKAEYDKRFGGEAQQEYHARHILVETQEEAQKVLQQLEKGTEFAKLAEEFSTGPTGPNGGDLGWFQPEQMVPPFAEAVRQLKPGSYTKEPVQTQFGWHVIKLEETRPVTPPALEEVREQVVAALNQQRVEQQLEKLRQAAAIRFENGSAAAQPQQEAEAAPAQKQAE